MKYFYINNIKFKYSLTNISIIDFCENIGINIPHFCYHKNLSIAGNCRMCLVELKNSPKPLISCAMPLSSNMQIYTHSVLVQKARENIMEFLLLNHPLDCPVCDQGGECDLQDQSFLFGNYKTRFYNYKKVVTNKNLGVIVKTVMTRCIHCTRCVRFSDEISGSSDLGMFGRGNKSEIGTYVKKIFKSELSGNIIDICPVGALTSKPHPFVSRSWELKTVKSFDFLDSFGSSIQLCLKDNSLIKVLPNFNETFFNYCNGWITDKTRFSFTGMFSPDRITETFIFSEKIITKKSWKLVFKDIIYNIYFQEHLSKHFYDNLKITFVLNEEVSLDTLNLVCLLKKNYSFFSIKNVNNTLTKNDFESNFFLNSLKVVDKLKSNFCVLINFNPRLENYLLNLKLKKLYLKGNFNILMFGSLIDLTYPVKYLGSNLNLLKNISEGNHPYCQSFKQSINPFLIVSDNSYKRNDLAGFHDIISNFEKYFKPTLCNVSGFNFSHTTLSDCTFSYINSLKKFSFNDYKNSLIFYFLNVNYAESLLIKLIELKLIKEYLKLNIFNKMFINQHNSQLTDSFFKVNKEFNSNFFVNLPTKVFFETSELYLNNQGILLKKIKVLNALNNAKSNWKIIRSLQINLKKITFSSNTVNNMLSLNIKKRKFFLEYLSYFFLPSFNFLSKKKFFIVKSSNVLFPLTNITTKYYKNKKKVLNSKSILWLEDFYIGGKDLYSSFSLIMIKCSKDFRSNASNFQYIL